MELNKIAIKKLICQSYSQSFDNFKMLLMICTGFAVVDLAIDWLFDILFREEYRWLLPDATASRHIIMLSIVKVLLFSLFTICWAMVVSKHKMRLSFSYYTKIAVFIAIWLVWHYVSFLGIYNLYNGRFAPVDLLVIVAGAYLPFVWVRFYSLLARLLDNEEIASLSEFLDLTKGQVIRICIALLFVVVPCSIIAWSFTVYFDGNLIIGEFVLNMILLFFTSVWINHCYVQNQMLLAQKS